MNEEGGWWQGGQWLPCYHGQEVVMAGPAWGSKSGEKGLDSGDVLETELMELPRDRMGA